MTTQDVLKQLAGGTRHYVPKQKTLELVTHNKINFFGTNQFDGKITGSNSNDARGVKRAGSSLEKQQDTKRQKTIRPNEHSVNNSTKNNGSNNKRKKRINKTIAKTTTEKLEIRNQGLIEKEHDNKEDDDDKDDGDKDDGDKDDGDKDDGDKDDGDKDDGDKDDGDKDDGDKDDGNKDDDKDDGDKDDDKDDDDKDDEGIDEDDNEATKTLKAASNPEVLKKYKIKVIGYNVSLPLKIWDELETKFNCRKYLKKNILTANYTSPTPVQMQVIPALLTRREVLVAAPTGSGKTAAYAIPILHLIGKPSKDSRIFAVIVVPTNELANQVMSEFEKLSAGKPFKIINLSKVSKNVMTNASDEYGPNVLGNSNVIISTPKRLLHVLGVGSLDLKSVELLVLDESDKLFTGDFLSQIDSIIGACSNPQLRVSMFSATMLPVAEEMAKSVMKDPVKILVGRKNVAVSNVSQKLIYCGSEEGKVIALRNQIRKGIKPPVLIFVQSKERAQELFREFVFENLNVGVISADKTPVQRELTTEQFRNGKIWILIATNLFSRGLDFSGISLVINFDLPQSAADYIHRVGRTGRMGNFGVAHTYYTDEDIPHLKQIVNVMKNSGQFVPKFLQELKLESSKSRKHLEFRPVERASVGTSHENSKFRKRKSRDVRNIKKNRKLKKKAE